MKIKTCRRNMLKIYKQLGKYLCNFHKNKGNGFGKLNNLNGKLLIGEHNNKDHII